MTVEDEQSENVIEDLLGLPFDDAIERCQPLRQYIERHEDRADLEVEFRQSWHRNAPAELRQILEELVYPETANANAAATVEFLKNPMHALPLDDESLGRGGVESSDMEQDLFNSFDDEIAHQRSRASASSRREDMHTDAVMDDEMDAEDGESQGPDLSLVIDSLLGQTFEQALQDCGPLRKYVEHHEDAKELADEFRQSWHPDAPAELRQVLEELLNPEAAAKSAAELASFNQRMAASIEPADARGLETSGDDRMPRRQRSRL